LNGDNTYGHVQEALEEDGVPRITGAILCGMEGMIDAVTNLLVDAGVSKDGIVCQLLALLCFPYSSFSP
jgi:hypothetical protein